MKSLALFVTLVLLGSSLAAGSAQKSQDKKDKKEPAPLHVKLNVIITDSNYQPVNDLKKDRFRVFENDVPQTVSLFELKAKSPGFVIAVDTSLSLRREIAIVLATATLIVNSTAPDEQVMLMRFVSSDKIQRAQDFTSDHAALLKAIDGLYLEGGQSAVIDAISLANDSIEEFTKDKGNVRRSLILITDGEDRHSFFTTPQLLAQLRRTGAQVLVLSFPRGIETQRGREKAANLLNRLAQETGGNVFYPDSVADIERDVKQIMLEMRAPYVIGYESTNPARDGSFRKVRVEVVTPPEGPKVLGFVRDGYTSPK